VDAQHDAKGFGQAQLDKTGRGIVGIRGKRSWVGRRANFVHAGTLSVAVHDDDIEIHALDEGLVEDLRRGVMARRARRVEGE
jgi:hypothetical protein